MMFFFIVIIITLNLIFGVIIDNFADLRTEKQRNDEVLRNTCFICGTIYSGIDDRDARARAVQVSIVNPSTTSTSHSKITFAKCTTCGTTSTSWF